MPLIIKKIMNILLKKKCRGKIILTYDDGPGPFLESKLLKILKTYDAKATFFLSGIRAELYQEQCELLLKNGHEIACHSYNHLHPYKNAPWRILRDINKAFTIMNKIVNKDVVYRPPYGKLTFSLYLYLFLNKSKLVFWTIDSGDTFLKTPDPYAIVNKVVQERGAIVLMHSFDRDSNDKTERSDYVLNITQNLLKMAQHHGLTVCTINDLFFNKK